MDREQFLVEAEYLLRASLFAFSSLPRRELLHPTFKNTYEIATHIGLLLNERGATKRNASQS